MANIDYSIIDIEKVVKFDGKVKSVEVVRLTAPGENYLSLVLRADFELEKNGSSKTISTVVKRLPLKRNEQGSDLHSHAMKNEIIWYSEIVPILKDFAIENEVEMDFYPEMYGSRYSLDPTKEEADGDSVLILENLIPQGYKNEDRYVGFDLITSKATLKELVIFHALPIAMKLKKPEQFKILKDYLDSNIPKRHNKDDSSDPNKKRNHGGRPGTKRPDEALLEQLAKLPDVAPYLSKIKPLFGKKMSMDPEAERKLTKEPWNTNTHNDFWANNVMVNYRSEKEPLVKIVDFQMCFYGAFAKDVVFFLLTSVRNDVIEESMDELLRFYYDELMSILKTAKVNVELTYEDYLEEIRSAAAESELGHALFFSTIIFGKKYSSVDDILDDSDKDDPSEHMNGMIRNMSQLQKDKLSLIVTEAVKRSWI